MLHDDRLFPRTEHPDAYRRKPVINSKYRYIRINTACKRCGSLFVGNAEDVVKWENHHFDKCERSDS
jgi:hypothetical protein